MYHSLVTSQALKWLAVHACNVMCSAVQCAYDLQAAVNTVSANPSSFVTPTVCESRYVGRVYISSKMTRSLMTQSRQNESNCVDPSST